MTTKSNAWMPISTAPKYVEILISDGEYTCIGVLGNVVVEDSKDGQDLDSYYWFAKSPAGIADIDDDRQFVEILDGKTPTMWMPIPNLALMSDTDSVLHEVASERARQNTKWGGPSVDDARKTPIDWCDDIAAYISWAKQMALMGSHDKYRRRVMQVAALAVAACQSYDRTQC